MKQCFACMKRIESKGNIIIKVDSFLADFLPSDYYLISAIIFLSLERWCIIKNSYKMPEKLWTPLASAILILCSGILSELFKLPLLFPSLGVIALTQALQTQINLSVYRKLLGGIIPVFAGYLSIIVLQSTGLPSFKEVGYTLSPHIMASMIGIALTAYLQIITKTIEPAGGATLLLITLGVFKTNFHDIFSLISGICIMIIIADRIEWLRVKKKL